MTHTRARTREARARARVHTLLKFTSLKLPTSMLGAYFLRPLTETTLRVPLCRAHLS